MIIFKVTNVVCRYLVRATLMLGLLEFFLKDEIKIMALIHNSDPLPTDNHNHRITLNPPLGDNDFKLQRHYLSDSKT